ncbi:MAG: Ig-like domain-containing protein [Prevotella sp.]|nr:Ig-like domain-containing protein [Prevotella sp.]
MMKELRIYLTMLLLSIVSVGFAGTIVFGDLELENGVQYTDPFDGGDFTVTFAGGGNDGKYYTTGSGIRVYGGGTMTIAAKSGNVTSITITYDGNNKPTTDDVVNTGTYTNTTGVWAGEAGSVVFTRPSGSGHWRVQKIEVTVKSGTVITKQNAVLSFDPTSLSLTEGESQVVSFSKGETDGAVTFTSSNEEVATYDAATNTVNAISEGTVTITATSAETENYYAGTAVLNVTVNPIPQTEVTLPYEESFANNIGSFTIDDVSLAEGLSYVWKHDSNNKYMKASAYAGGSNNAAESWLVSPIIDATSATNSITFTFSHCINKYFGDVEEEATVWVKEEGGEWTQHEISYPTVADGKTWSSMEQQEVDLSAYKGKKFQIGFKYLSTTDAAGTWEVKGIKVEEVIPVKPDAELAYSVNAFTATIGEENTFPVLDNPNELAVTYTSSNEDVATIDAEGNITLVAAGTTNITATSEETDEFKAGEAKYVLTVKEPVVPSTDKFELVTDASTLEEGDEIIIAYVDEDGALAMGGQNTNNRAAVEVIYNDDETLTPNSDAQVITLEGDEDGWYFNVGNGYLYAASSSKNNMKTKPETDDNAKATIEINENGDATIIFQGEFTHNHLRFNPNNGSPMFSCYEETSSIQNLPRIYRKVTAVEEEFISVTISSAEYATLYYSDKAFEIPEGVTAQIVTGVSDKSIEFENLDGIIPAGTGVVLNGPQGTYDFKVVYVNSVAPVNNKLKGYDASHLTEGGDKYYKLTVKDDKVGFYWGEENGEAFESGAHKAYLALSADEAKEMGYFFDGLVTEIRSIGTETVNGDIYTIGGVRVKADKLQKGIYIVNGKKMVVK